MKKADSHWDTKDNEKEAKRLENIRNDDSSKETKAQVKKEVEGIKGLNKDIDSISNPKGGLTCCFKNKWVKNQKQETHDLII